MINRSLIAVDDDDRVMGLLPLYEVAEKRSRVFPWRKLVSSIEFPGGPLVLGTDKVATDTTKDLVDAARSEAHRIGVDAIEIRYPSIIAGAPAISKLGYYPLRRYGFRERTPMIMFTALDLCKSIDNMFQSLSSTCRRKIRRATDSGVTCRTIEKREEWIASYPLYADTLGGRAISLEVFSSIWDDFVVPRRATPIGAYLDGTLVCAVLGIQNSTCAYYWIGYRSKAHDIYGLHSLTLWQSILNAKTAGCKYYEVGSLYFGSGRDKSISDFKRTFHGDIFYQLSGSYLQHPIKDAAISLADAGLRLLLIHGA